MVKKKIEGPYDREKRWWAEREKRIAGYGIQMFDSEGLLEVRRNDQPVFETDSFKQVKAFLQRNKETKGKTFLYKDGLLVGQISKSGKIKNKEKEIVDFYDIPNKGVKDLSDLE